jgi:hypothetical protein
MDKARSHATGVLLAVSITLFHIQNEDLTHFASISLIDIFNLGLFLGLTFAARPIPFLVSNFNFFFWFWGLSRLDRVVVKTLFKRIH